MGQRGAKVFVIERKESGADMRYSAQKVWANNSRSEKLVFLVAAPKESDQIIPEVTIEDSPRS